MKIVFSDHSKEQNKIRKIPLPQIKETINNPDKKIVSFPDRYLYQKSFSDKILEVVIKIENNQFIVITQYYLVKYEN